MKMTRRSMLSMGAMLAPERRPNILLLIADNWAYPHAGIYGTEVSTPAFDQVAREGVLFDHAFAPTPSCSPSRSSLLTGQDSHRLQDAANLYGNLKSSYNTYPELLAAAGYFTGYSGKGWAPGSAEASGRRENPAGPHFARFDEMLTARPAGAPFCYWFGSQNPHVPWNQGQSNGIRPQSVRVPKHLPDDPAVRADIVSYLGEVQAFDKECGAILDRLRASGELDNTLVVMTSDNGWQMPRGLANCYDLGVRIPMAIRWPRGFKPGSRRSDFVSLTDLMPTFLEAAGVRLPSSVTAASLLSRVRRDRMFLERERHANVRRGDLSYPIRGLRTRDYLYLWNVDPDRWPAGDPEFYWAVGPYGDIDDSATKRLLLERKPQPYFDLCMAKRPAEELYDLAKDPDQIANVAAKPEYARVRQRMRREVEQWMRKTADPRAAGATDFWDRVPYGGPRFDSRRGGRP